MSQSNPNQQPWVRKTLRYCTNMMTAVCLIDATAEGLSQGAWHSDISIFPIYHFLLLTYSGARAWEKWKKKDRQEDKIWGEKWMLAWIGVVGLLWLVDISMYPVYQPRHLYNTIMWVFGIYAVTKGPFLLQDLTQTEPVITGGNQGTDTGGPVADNSPESADDGQETSDDNPKIDKVKLAALIREYCRKAGDFTTQQVGAEYGLSDPTARGFIIQLLLEKVAIKISKDHYRWVGDTTPPTGV